MAEFTVIVYEKEDGESYMHLLKTNNPKASIWHSEGIEHG